MKEIRVAVCECFSPLMGLDGAIFSMADFAGEYCWPFKDSIITIEDADPRVFLVTAFSLSAPKHDYVASRYPCQFSVDVFSQGDGSPSLITRILVPGCTWVNSVYWNIGSEGDVLGDALLQIILQIARVPQLHAETAGVLWNSFADLN